MFNKWLDFAEVQLVYETYERPTLFAVYQRAFINWLEWHIEEVKGRLCGGCNE